MRAQRSGSSATQFEVLTAAALAEFAEAGVDVAVVEAGLGGRHDATNVLARRFRLLTNVALEHTEVLGETREAIAAEKLAVVACRRESWCSDEPEWEALARGTARRVVVAGTATWRSPWPPPRRSSAAPSTARRGGALPGRLERRRIRSRSGTARTISPGVG